jgi:hypothetical protein
MSSNQVERSEISSIRDIKTTKLKVENDVRCEMLDI